MTTPRVVIKTRIQKLHGMVTPRLIIKNSTQILKGETIAETGDDCRKWRRLQSKTVCPKLEETIAKRRLQPKSMCPKFEETIAKRRLRRLRVSWTCPRRLRKDDWDDCVCPGRVRDDCERRLWTIACVHLVDFLQPRPGAACACGRCARL